ncbi:HNH endonuclease [Rothia amarae]|uniref:HNH endonuclease n=2 Tax=Rothia amarae TaxID=169480 RepID=A0A7H2BLU9_9MICC|nr:HNH endonuclease [Rothia amarae]
MKKSPSDKTRHAKIQIIIPERVAERAATRYEVDEYGCWISTYSVASHGYAQVGWQDARYRQVVTAHRASWVYFNGQIPDGMTVDHMCKVRRCVNPLHLRIMSNVANARGGGGLHKQKPVPTDKKCARGHVVLSYPSGALHCRECAQEWARRKRFRQSLSKSGVGLAS